ncbi:MAG: PfkB family carbohydrate kinase [Balneolaceae bacterium]|nr:PfkB family carbohydrate kinase [Balneolaceae bacterium]
MSNYKVAVLGPIPRDHIVTHRDEVIEKYGCVTHTAIALSNLLGDEGTVIPVSHIRKRDESPIKELLNRYANIETTHVSSEADQGDVISLNFVDQNKRLEKQSGFMNPILPEDLEGLMDCDIFVCVPITDYEVPRQTIKYIKENSDGIVIFDAHGPTNTITVTGDRLIKFWIDRDRWLPHIDVLKMNIEESICCWFRKEYDPEELGPIEEETEEHLPDLAKHCLDHGVKSLIITLDDRGGLVFYMEDGAVRQELVPSVTVDHVVDTTGCGDSFAGGLAYGLLEDRTDYIRATKYANAVGAQRTQGRTFEVFKSCEETENMIIENYGSL